MNSLRISLIVIVSLALIVSAGYLYASSGIESKSGYAELVTPSGEPIDTLLSVNLGRGGVKPVRWLLAQIADDSDLEHEMPKRVFKSVLQDLQGVQLRIYEVGDNQPIFDAAIAESATALKQKNWQSVVAIREDQERIVVMQYVDNEKVTGLSIMASTPDTALFINLIGPFDLDVIAGSMEQRH